MRCRFGMTTRKDLPTTLEPAPPFFFSMPRLLYLLPDVDDLSQIIQALMAMTSSSRVKTEGLNILKSK